MPFHASRDSNRGANYATTDLRFTKSMYVNRDRGVRVDLIAQGTNIWNHVNFNKVSDVFDINGFPTANLANGQTLNLITGPYTGLHGVAPKTLSDIQKPLSYASADEARRVQFGLKVAF